MSWLYLVMAILFEVSGTTNMKLSQGFTRLVPSILVFVFYGVSFTCMTLALKEIDVGVAYAVWAGIGTVLIVLIGVVWFGETATLLRLGSITLIIIGVVGLHLAERAM